MSLEATLESIDATLKALLLSAQTSAAAVTEFGAAAPAEKPKRTAKAAVAASQPAFALVDGDAAGTRYFVIDKHNTAARILQGEVAPSIESAVEVDGPTYLTKKAEFEKKSVVAATPAAPATTAASATPPADASTSGSEITFKTVVERLTILSKDTRPGNGREGVLAILNAHLAHLPEAERKVPKLEALKKNAELLAAVDAKLSDVVADADIFG